MDEVDAIFTRVVSYVRDVHEVHQRLDEGVRSIATAAADQTPPGDQKTEILLNPWSFPITGHSGVDLARLTNDPLGTTGGITSVVRDIPGCGYGTAAPTSGERVQLAEGLRLQNELLELTVSALTGGIQALRTHRDRSTRVSQRLIYHKHRPGRDAPTLDTQMVADQVEITRNDGVFGEITAHGRILDAAEQVLARFTQSVQLARGMAAAFVQVAIDPQQPLHGDLWESYFASRLAWSDEAVSFRRGVQWQAQETGRQRIESSEFVEISNGSGNIVCFALGLPFHRRASTTWLDTLLCVAGQSKCQFQFALGLDCLYPTQTALDLTTSGASLPANFSGSLNQSRGWFLHLGARNLIITHLELLDGARTGIRCRILETEGRAADTKLSAYRPFLRARTTDFRAEGNEVLSVVNGTVHVAVGPHQWVQIEAEW
jgi:alpha-mannosidase